MIEQIIVISLIITAIYVSMWDGMIFHAVRRWVCIVCDLIGCPALRKPLCECLICMGGIYTLILYPILYGWSWTLIPTMLGVIGLNTIIATMLCRMTDRN